MNTIRYRHKSPDAHLVGKTVVLTCALTDAEGDVYPAGTPCIVVQAYRGLNLRPVGKRPGEALLQGVPADAVEEARGR